MKKITKTLLTVVCASSMMPIGVLSANTNETPLVNDATKDETNLEMNVDQMFESFDPTKKVLQLPDGGFIQGVVTEYDGSVTITEYNSETDDAAVLINEAKEIVKADKLGSGNPSISTYGTSIPTATRSLALGTGYVSERFSGAGWRLGEIKFKPAAYTGDYLLWTSRGDSGNAGTESQAGSTIYGGVNNGVALANGVSTYVFSANWTMYYTFNPIDGSYYVVQNI